MSKLNELTIAVFLTVTGYAKNLKDDLMRDERGLSGVVVAVLLILVAVLAVVMIWGFLSGWLSDMWENITSQSEGIA